VSKKLTKLELTEWNDSNGIGQIIEEYRIHLRMRFDTPVDCDTATISVVRLVTSLTDFSLNSSWLYSMTFYLTDVIQYLEKYLDFTFGCEEV
jgi:hypothetical protein